MRARPIILIIEDEELLSQMYEHKFVHDGYECHIAGDGIEGLKKAKELLPDLILCDIMMPYKDGITVLGELKADANLKPIPVVMLTNLSEEGYVSAAIDLGAVSYLVKSNTDPSTVVSKTKEILQAQGKRILLSK
jgi:two-component system alkaline phosphatase synthesis response regulator PhoP